MNKANVYLIIKQKQYKCMSREKTLKKGYENIENELYLYFVIILPFVLVDKLFKK